MWYLHRLAFLFDVLFDELSRADPHGKARRSADRVVGIDRRIGLQHVVEPTFGRREQTAFPNLVSTRDDAVVRQDFAVEADEKPGTDRTVHLRRWSERSAETTAEEISLPHSVRSDDRMTVWVVMNATTGLARLGTEQHGRPHTDGHRHEDVRERVNGPLEVHDGPCVQNLIAIRLSIAMTLRASQCAQAACLANGASVLNQSDRNRAASRDRSLSRDSSTVQERKRMMLDSR
jgi:hypothetical protein